MSTLQRLTDRGLVKPPRWLPANVQYETIMGSVAYGVSSDTSDVDVYGWAIPPKEDVFPHLARRGPRVRPPAQAVRAVPGAPRPRPGRPGRARPHLRPDRLRHRQVLPAGDGEQPERHRQPVHPGHLRAALDPGRQPGPGEPPAVPAPRGVAEVQGVRLLASCTSWRSRSRRASGPNWWPSTATTPSSPTTSSGCSGEVEQILRRGGHRPPARQRAAQGDPPRRVDRGPAPAVGGGQGGGPGAGVRREHAARRRRTRTGSRRCC